MAEAAEIRGGQEVVGADGVRVGIVDRMDGPDQIKLVRRPEAGRQGEYLPLAMVARVDVRVHLSVPAAAAFPIAGETLGGELPLSAEAVPPLRNRAVEGAPARRNFLLPWVVGLVGLLLLALLIGRLVRQHPERTAAITPAPVAALPVGSVTLPDGTTLPLAPDTLNYALQRFLASEEPTPRTFTFDHLNFATSSAAIRPEDEANVDALSRILAAYPHAIVTITGYADARGAAGTNAALGQQRADAVVKALADKGVARDRMTATSGGEGNPAASNASAGGQFENRRSELTVTTK